MKAVKIIALHLAFGGIEKAIISMANLFAERYDVEIISVYNMPGGPAFPLDERVKVRYLLDVIPNKEEWKAAVKALKPVEIARESLKSVNILRRKKQAVIQAIKGIDEGIIICTRPEDNLLLSKYGRAGVQKIAQYHQDHAFDKKLLKGFRESYGNIDQFLLLTPGLRDEVKAVMDGGNKHTEVMYMPNFLEHYPQEISLDNREKVILSVGRLNEVKRVELLIESFARLRDRLPGWSLRIVGEGEERGKLERLIAEKSLENQVFLTGMKDGKGVEEEMLRASLFAMCSRSEGFPFVLLEAQSCGLPAVAFDVRVGTGFVIRHGKNGFLASEGDFEGFDNFILSLAGDEEMRKEMGRKGMENAALFSKEEVSKRWFELLGE